MRDVDDVVVLRLCAGIPVVSTHLEKLEAVRILRTRGMTASCIARMMHASRLTVAKLWREEQPA